MKRYVSGQLLVKYTMQEKLWSIINRSLAKIKRRKGVKEWGGCWGGGVYNLIACKGLDVGSICCATSVRFMPEINKTTDGASHKTFVYQ